MYAIKFGFDYSRFVSFGFGLWKFNK